MSRDFFEKPAAGIVLVSGTVITDIQIALNATGPAITVDGLYGGQTTTAVSRLQAAKALPVTGNVSDATWLALMGTIEPDIFARCLQVTASFEGTHFTEVVGNSDGAGLTWGIIGFTLLDGNDLGALLRDIDSAYPALINSAFGPDAGTLMNMSGPTTTDAEKTIWANSLSYGPQNASVAEPWLTYFRTLGNFPEVQHLQVQRARAVYWSIAKTDAASLGLGEELDYMLMYDTAVQNGGMSAHMLTTARNNIAAAAPATAGARRLIIADVVANSAKPAYQADVLARKTAIANGNGIVHRGVYDLARWGLIDGASPAST